MRKSQSGFAVAGIAIMRAVDERICYDSYARRFVPGWLYDSIRFLIRSGHAEWRGPGVNGFLTISDRYIDNVLQDLLSKGLEQLILPQSCTRI